VNPDRPVRVKVACINWGTAANQATASTAAVAVWERTPA